MNSNFLKKKKILQLRYRYIFSVKIFFVILLLLMFESD